MKRFICTALLALALARAEDLSSISDDVALLQRSIEVPEPIAAPTAATATETQTVAATTETAATTQWTPGPDLIKMIDESKRREIEMNKADSKKVSKPADVYWQRYQAARKAAAQVPAAPPPPVKQRQQPPVNAWGFPAQPFPFQGYPTPAWGKPAAWGQAPHWPSMLQVETTPAGNVTATSIHDLLFRQDMYPNMPGGRGRRKFWKHKVKAKRAKRGR